LCSTSPLSPLTLSKAVIPVSSFETVKMRQ
jgi:hypothetical protein